MDDTSNITCLESTLFVEVLNTTSPEILQEARGRRWNNMDGNTIYPNNDNKQFTLDCSVKGIPEPIITWYKDNVPILDIKDLSSMIEEDGKELKISWQDKEGEDHTKLVNHTVAGTYKCVASNIAGNLTMVKHISMDDSLQSWIQRLWEDPFGRTLLTSITITFVVLTLLLLCVLYLCRRQKLAKEEISAREIACFLHGNPDEYNESLPVEEQVCLLPYDDDIEFPKQRLTLGLQIGSGAFGRVVSIYLTIPEKYLKTKKIIRFSLKSLTNLSHVLYLMNYIT